MSLCPICRQRKGKRQCPAKAASLCPACCGSHRRVEIDCPEGCTWLEGVHAGNWEGRETEARRDARRLGPFLEDLEQEEEAPLFLMTLATLPSIRSRHSGLDDARLLEALRVSRQTVETREKGVLYEHASDDPRTQAVVQELSGLYEARDDDGSLVRPREAALLKTLRALERAVAACQAEQAGPALFLETATRLAGKLLGPRAAAKGPRKPLLIQPE